MEAQHSGFILDVPETFTETMVFRQPGGGVGKINCEYRYMDGEQYEKYFGDHAAKESTDAETAAGILVSWDANLPADESGIKRLFTAFPVAGRAFFATYREALHGPQQQKN